MSARKLFTRLLQLSNELSLSRKTELHWTWKQILSNYILMDAGVSEKVMESL